MSETKQRLSAVKPGAFLGERPSDEEWKAIEEIGAENGHVDGGWGEGLACKYCDARIKYKYCDERDGKLFDWYERGYLTKRCVSPEDREWIRRAFKKAIADLLAVLERARERGLSDDTLDWALEAEGVDPDAIFELEAKPK
jgi:hypothetical protein